MVDLTPGLLDKFKRMVGSNNKRALGKKAPGVLEVPDVVAKYVNQRACCYYCAVIMSPTIMTLEHLVPMGTGGTNFPDNVALACHDCNLMASQLATAKENAAKQQEESEQKKTVGMLGKINGSIKKHRLIIAESAKQVSWLSARKKELEKRVVNRPLKGLLVLDTVYVPKLSVDKIAK